MPWKRGKIKLKDGSVYPAELLIEEDGEVWNVKVFKENNVIEEIDAKRFAEQLKKDVNDVYPFDYEIE